MPQTNQINLPAWLLRFTDSHLSVDYIVNKTAVGVTFAVDCTSAVLSMTAVASVNNTDLAPNGSESVSGDLPIPVNPESGRSYASSASVTLNSFACFVDVQPGIYWAECNPPGQGRALPRFVFRARSVM